MEQRTKNRGECPKGLARSGASQAQLTWWAPKVCTKSLGTARSARFSSTENPLTGKPDAGNPPVRFGGRGSGHPLSLPLSQDWFNRLIYGVNGSVLDFGYSSPSRLPPRSVLEL
jgi:hypothetical protein